MVIHLTITGQKECEGDDDSKNRCKMRKGIPGHRDHEDEDGTLTICEEDAIQWFIENC